MSDRSRNLRLGFLVVLVGAAVYYGLFPMVSGYWSVTESLRQRVHKLQRDNQLLRRAPEIQARARQTRERLRRVVPGRLPKAGFSVVLSRLEEQALKAGLTEANIDQINQQSDRSRRNIRELQVRARFTNLTRSQLIRLLWRFRRFIGQTTMLRYKQIDLQFDDRAANRIPTVELTMVFYDLQIEPRPDQDPESDE